MPLKSSYFADHRIEVGCDEVGRGALAGPVVAAAVIWNPDIYNERDDDTWKFIRDSKKLSAARRGMLADYIMDTAVDFAVSHVSAEEIDRINILQATMKAIHNALDTLSVDFDHIIVDGDKFKPYMPLGKQDDDGGFIPHTCIVQGDDSYMSIAAASILAKVSRDDTMCQLSSSKESMLVYNWPENKGYGTRAHFDAIKTHGIVMGLHRQSFLKKTLQSI